MLETQGESPFSQLQNLEHLYLEKSGVLSEDGQAKEEWTGVLFRIGTAQLLAPMNLLMEIIPPGKLTKVPGVKPWILGVANQHGALIPIVDLQCFFFGKAMGKSDVNQRMLITFDGVSKVGLLVNEVFGMKHFWDGDEVDVMPNMAPELKPYTPLSLKRYGEHYAVLDVQKLINSQAFIEATL